MVDEIYDRHYLAARRELNSALSDAFVRFGRAFGNAFLVLNRIEYSAPWRSRTKKARCN